MTNMKQLAVICGLVLAVPLVGQAEKQPRMKAALASLIVAQGQLNKSSHDKGGHRVKALAATKEAIEQTQKGIAFDNKHLDESQLPTMEKQPHMQAALAALKNARQKLKNSTHDKGGHRVKALAATQIAINQVKLGIKFDNKNKRR